MRSYSSSRRRVFVGSVEGLEKRDTPSSFLVSNIAGLNTSNVQVQQVQSNGAYVLSSNVTNVASPTAGVSQSAAASVTGSAVVNNSALGNAQATTILAGQSNTAILSTGIHNQASPVASTTQNSSASVSNSALVANQAQGNASVVGIQATQTNVALLSSSVSNTADPHVTVSQSSSASVS